MAGASARWRRHRRPPIRTPATDAILRNPIGIRLADVAAHGMRVGPGDVLLITENKTGNLTQAKVEGDKATL